MAERKPVPAPTAADLARFMSKVAIRESGCWEWTGGRFSQGYGAFVLGGQARRAHRVLYVWMQGELEPGKHLDHQCDNPPCVNPRHLKPATDRENTLRSGRSLQAKNAAKTRCANGHEFTDENTVRDAKGWRQCRTCLNAKARRYAAANRERVRIRQREAWHRDHPEALHRKG